MKRKFFTLLAASLAIGTSAYAQCPSETETAVAKIESGEYYYLRHTTAPATDADLNTDEYFSVTKGIAGDSIIVVPKAGLSAELDSATWQVVKLDDKFYSFKNKATGNTLTLKAGAAVASKFGWNFETGGKPEKLSFINNYKNFQMDINAAGVVGMKETASEGINVYPTLPGWKKVTLGELNKMYSDFFKLYDKSDVSGTEQAQNSHKAIESKFHATDRAADDATATTYYLNVVGSKKYLNVDTTYYNRIGLIDSTAQLGGHTLVLDTIANEKEDSTYLFTIWKNVKDSIAVQVYGIPAIANPGETFEQQNATAGTDNGWITLSSYDAGFEKTALTASVGCFNKYMPNPQFSLTKGEGAQINAGYYYIYKGMTTDTMLVAQLNNKMNEEQFVWAPSNAGAQYVPAAQWYVPAKSYSPSVYNRESTNDAVVRISKFYEVVDKDGKIVPNTYEVATGISGSDTVVMIPFASDDKYLGYKKFGKTAAEEAITEVYLQFNTKITGANQQAYIVKTAYATDSLLQVRMMDKENSRAYKIAPVDTFSIGSDELVAVSYNLYYTEGGKTYYVTGNVTDAELVKHTLVKSAAAEYLFRSTYTKDQYQILTVSPSTTGIVEDIRIATDGSILTQNDREVLDQVSVASSSAEVYNNAELNALNGAWSFINTLTPEYLTVERGHYRIYSSENTSLAVTVNPKDSAAILKAEADVPGYENAWFSLYVSPYETDTVRPTYFVGTTQQGMISDADRNAGHVSYMTNAGTFKKPINTETTDQDSISFVNGLVGAELDSISFFAADTLQSKTALDKTKKAYFAFLKVANGQDNEAYIESVRANDQKVYLAQSNGVLYFNEGISGQPAHNALKFVFGAPNKDVVTGNDEVSADAVKIVAAQGQVTIAGAAGKKVTISNILGQAIAETVLSSDNAVIAAPAGVVVVAVEGEEAVKAIVK